MVIIGGQTFNVNTPFGDVLFGNGNKFGDSKEGFFLDNVIATYLHGPLLSKNPELTDYIIKIVNKKDTPVVFILWGNFAKEKMKFITNPIHYVITSPHPSPFSARYGFFGSKPFSRTNEFLKSKNLKEINWARVE